MIADIVHKLKQYIAIFLDFGRRRRWLDLPALPCQLLVQGRDPRTSKDRAQHFRPRKVWQRGKGEENATHARGAAAGDDGQEAARGAGAQTQRLQVRTWARNGRTRLALANYLKSTKIPLWICIIFWLSNCFNDALDLCNSVQNTIIYRLLRLFSKCNDPTWYIDPDLTAKK